MNPRVCSANTKLNKFVKILSSIFHENGSLCVQTHNNYASEKKKEKKRCSKKLAYW